VGSVQGGGVMAGADCPLIHPTGPCLLTC
jgi:hypothetical protein